ncbi:MAG: ATP-binding cassette domain-containing protein [Oscillospiraceae bacterium]
MLKLKHITKDYVTKQNTVHVLKGITLNFRECEFVTILGQSGCGKTTLLNIIGGLDRYTDGDIIINGKSTKDFDDRDWDRYRNKQIGFVFQSYNLIPHLSVLSNVELALTLAGRKKAECEAIALEALRKVGLEDQAYKKPNQLSGGQMQRVAIARALVNNPAIILADEPTGALDTESGKMVMNLLKEVAEDRLVIMVSHNADLAAEYSTRTVRIVDGKVVDDTDPLIDPDDVAEEEVVLDESGEPLPKNKTIRQRIKKTYQQIRHERREERKVSMGGAMTLSISAKNLCSKKWRTFLTSFAGSIGIIGIALVLALSSGVNKYIRQTEESALSLYPLEISQSGADLMELANMLMAKSEGQKFPSGSTIGINPVAGNLVKGIGILEFKNNSTLFFENDLKENKSYLDDPDIGLKDTDGYVKYVYSSNLNVYRRIPVRDSATGEIKYITGFSGEKENKKPIYANQDTALSDIPYTKINPFADSIEPMIKEMGFGGAFKDMLGEFSGYLDVFSVFSELISNQKILEQQYDVLAGAWPEDAKQGRIEVGEDGKEYKVFDCVLKVDEYNKIQDFMLFAAGLVHPSEVKDMFGGPDSGNGYGFYDRNFTEEELLGIEYAILCDSDYFDVADDGKITESYLKNGKRIEDSGTFVDGHCGIKMKVSGVVRPNKNASASAIQGVVGYPHAVIEALVERCQSSSIINSQLTNCYQVLPDGSGYKVESEGTVATIDEEGNLVYSVDKDATIAFVSVLDTIGKTFKRGEHLDKSIIIKDADGSISKKDDLKKAVISHMKSNFGYAELDNPDSIQIYAANFDGKKNIIKVLDDYKNYTRLFNDDDTYTWVSIQDMKDQGKIKEKKELDEHGNVKSTTLIWTETGEKVQTSSIKYTDMLQTIMGYVEKMTNAMITALIAFSAVSLIVSSIMISIITYTSVLERRKEIGVLRSIGARKLDVSNLFISETSIIGMISGALGIGFGYLLIYIANVIIKKVIEIPNLLHLDWYYAISLFVISFFLSMIAGIIPAAIAANKDPVECLRSE